MSSGGEVRVNGMWMAGVAPTGGLSWSTAADGGCKEAKWQMDLPRRFFNPALVLGALVEVMVGAHCVWSGQLTEMMPGEDAWEFQASGLYSQGADFLALDAAGNATTKPNTAIDQAINGRVGGGALWTRATSGRPEQDFTNTAFVTDDLTDGLPRVGELLDAWADAQGVRWGVNANREVYWSADPTTPQWRLLVDDAIFGLADDEYASDVYVRYAAAGGLATATAGDAAARARWGRKEFPVDITTRGVLSPSAAAAHAAGLVAKGKARQMWVNGLEVDASQLTTIGGVPADLRLVRGQQMVRMFGVVDQQGAPLPYLDWVIGETEYEAGSSSISLTPLGLAERTLGDVLGGAA